MKWLVNWFGRKTEEEQRQCQTCPNMLDGREGEIRCSDSEGNVTVLEICSDCSDLLERRFAARDSKGKKT